LGDINNDSYVNVADCIVLINMIINGELDDSGDINQDGVVNVSDLITLISIILDS
jgi:hypothetical protein